MTIGFDRLKACVWSADDAAAVAQYTKKRKSTDWIKPTLADVRARLRTALLRSQCNACAYCRRMISIELGHHDIDHILAKGLSSYARFTYERLNLVASCKRCNRNKGNRDVLRTSLAITAPYPVNADDFLWIHPYLHSYSEHIRINEGVLFEAVGTAEQKARAGAVIDACGLKTLAVVEHRRAAEVVRYAENATFAITSMVGAHPDLSVEALATLLRKNRKEFRAVPSADVRQMIAAFRRTDLSELERRLRLHGLK